MQTAASSSCPECGAPAPMRGTVVSLVCEYCGSTVVRAGVDLRLVGRVSAILDDGSPIVLGARGSYRGLPFEIVGRLQLRYARGCWNEWYVQFPGDQAGWLSDAQGSHALTRPDGREATGELPAYASLSVGTWHFVHGTSYMVVDRRQARYQGAEGVLPFAAAPGLTIASADLAGADGEFLTIDYGVVGADAAPVAYVGAAVELKELGLSPLRRFEGWRG